MMVTSKIDHKEYETETMIHTFNELYETLTNDNELSNRIRKKIQSKTLSMWTAHIQLFMESFCGENRRKGAVKRLPAEIFTDRAGRGPLSVVLKTCIRYADKKKWKTFDWSNKSMIAKHMTMFRDVRKELRAANFLSVKSIFLANNIPVGTRNELVRIVNDQEDAKLCATLDEATHVVMYNRIVDDPEIREENQIRYLRTLEMDESEQRVRVHYWFFPDSYDRWISIDDVEGSIRPPEKESPVNSQTIFVSCRFLFDLSKFNEWPNPIDYEVDPEIQERIRRRIERRAKQALKPIKIRLLRVNEGHQRKFRVLEITGGPFFYDVDDNESSSDDDDEEYERETAARANLGDVDDVASPRRWHVRTLSEAIKINVDGDDMAKDKEDTVVDGLMLYRCAATKNNEFARGHEEELGPRRVAISMQGATDSTNADDEIDDRDQRKRKRDDSNRAVASRQHLNQNWSRDIRDKHSTTRLATTSWFDSNVVHDKERLELPEWFDGTSMAKTPNMYVQCRNAILDAYYANPSSYLSATECRRTIAGDACAIMRVHAMLERHGLINFDAIEPSAARMYLSSEDFRRRANELSTSTACNARDRWSGERTHYGASLSRAPAPFVCARTNVNNDSFETVRETPDGDEDVSVEDKKDAKQLGEADGWNDEDTVRLLEYLHAKQVDAAVRGRTYDPDWKSVAKAISGTHSPEGCREKFLSLYNGDDKDPRQRARTLMSSAPVGDSNPSRSDRSALTFLASRVTKELVSAALEASDVDPEQRTRVNETTKTLTSAVSRAKALISEEEREIWRLEREIIRTQARRLREKMTYLSEFENILDMERDTLADERDRVLHERLLLRK